MSNATQFIPASTLSNHVEHVAATTAPSANSDAANTDSNGIFTVGSMWIDTTNNVLWKCVDSTATAAIWQRMIYADMNGNVSFGSGSNPILTISMDAAGTGELRFDEAGGNFMFVKYDGSIGAPDYGHLILGSDTGGTILTLARDTLIATFAGDEVFIGSGASTARLVIVGGATGDVGHKVKQGTNKTWYYGLDHSGNAAGLNEAGSYNFAYKATESGISLTTHSVFEIGTTGNIWAKGTAVIGASLFTPSASADNLQVFAAANGGITIGTGATSDGYIMFGRSGAVDQGYIRYDHAADAMSFRANNAVVLTLESGGGVSVEDGEFVVTNTSNVGNMIEGRATNVAYESAVFRSVVTDVATGSAFYHFYSTHTVSAASACRIMDDGDIENANNSYGAWSDRKLKQDIIEATSQWDDVKDMAAAMSKFRLKSQVAYMGDDAPVQIGWVAQDLEMISPGLVTERPDMADFIVQEAKEAVLDEDGYVIEEAVKEKTEFRKTGETTKAVRTSIAFLKAFKALGEALERIEDMEARLEAAGIPL